MKLKVLALLLVLFSPPVLAQVTSTVEVDALVAKYGDDTPDHPEWSGTVSSTGALVSIHPSFRDTGEWLWTASAAWLNGPGIGAGIGYRWPSGLEVTGQVIYADQDSGCDSTQVTVPPMTRPRVVPRTVTCPGCELNKWAGIITFTHSFKHRR